MNLKDLQSGLGRKRPQRVARGGKRGTTSGRGQKGQKSRSGRRIRPAVRDLITRLAKKRGYRNKPITSRPLEINLNQLNQLAKRETARPLVVDRDFLISVGLVPSSYRGSVKILSTGRLEFPISLRGLRYSKKVTEIVSKAGGSVAGGNKPVLAKKVVKKAAVSKKK